jgi:hypothetical protein
VTSHPDWRYHQLFKYFIQKLFQILIFGPTRECMLFEIQSNFSYYCSMKGFPDINNKIHLKKFVCKI